eukprot:scaffold496102_cov20-Prasinocladus_malaysianus.AAC.1
MAVELLNASAVSLPKSQDVYGLHGPNLSTELAMLDALEASSSLNNSAQRTLDLLQALIQSPAEPRGGEGPGRRKPGDDECCRASSGSDGRPGGTEAAEIADKAKIPLPLNTVRFCLRSFWQEPQRHARQQLDCHMYYGNCADFTHRFRRDFSCQDVRFGT